VKRTVFDILRRGLDSTFANWQASLLRFVEGFVFVAIAIGGIIAIVVPILISIGINFTDIDTPEEFESIATALLEKWVLLLWIFLGISVLLLIFILVHSFVEAGCARVFAHAERVAGPEVAGPRARYRTFTIDRWWAGAKEGGWTLFWIYNAVWGLAGLLMLIPLLPTAALVFLLRPNEGAAVLTGCLGLILSLLFMFVLALGAGIWSNRAIVTWGVHGTGARESMSIAWQAIRADLGRHVLSALAILVVTFAGSMFLSSFSMFAGFGELFGQGEALFHVITLPLRFAGSILSSAFSALIGSWTLATYTALAFDPKR
jgi:hypothetical protein